jgi:hypothetical protein
MNSAYHSSVACSAFAAFQVVHQPGYAISRNHEPHAAAAKRVIGAAEPLDPEP